MPVEASSVGCVGVGVGRDHPLGMGRTCEEDLMFFKVCECRNIASLWIAESQHAQILIMTRYIYVCMHGFQSEVNYGGEGWKVQLY